MKINKMLIAIPAMLAVVLSSCKDDDPTVGIDSSMPAPAEVSYDEMNSSSSSIGVYWDANAALKSGATSFTVQILKKKDVGGDAYDNTVSHTLQSSDSPYDASQFTGLTEGSKYFVRVRANYPRSVYSEWAYILSSYNVPAKVKVGTGVMHIDPNAKNGPEDVTVVPFFSDLNLKWEEDDTAESYVIYIDDQKVGETEELSYHVTGLDYNTSYSVSVASVYSDGSEVKADPEPTKTGNIQQITRNFGPTHLSVNWDDVSGGAGAGSRAYQVELSKEESMANPIYSIYCVDGQASTNGSFGSSSWYGKENGTNLLPPTSISFGQLEPATTYYFRVKTVGNYSFQGSKGTVTIKATNGESDFSPVITLRTEAEHTPAANEILYQGFDNITMQSDFINTAAGTTPYWSDKAIVSKQADTPNPWEGAWVVYPFANSHLLATWGMASTANYIDGQATYKGQANRIAGDKSGSLKGWYIGDQVSPHQGYVKVGTSSKDGFYIATPALDSPLLSAEGTLCTFSFKGCPLMTDGRVVDIEVYRAATKTFEKVTSITMDSTLADGWTSSDYLCNYKWTTYSIDITLHPGDNVAVISTNKSRFAIDDIMIVKK